MSRDQEIKKFKKLFYVFVKKSVLKLRKTNIDFFEVVQGLDYGGEYGWGGKDRKVINFTKILSLHLYHNFFDFKEVDDISNFILKGNLFSKIEVITSSGNNYSSIAPKKYFDDYIFRLFQEFIEINNDLLYRKIALDKYLDDFFTGDKDKKIFLEVVFILPNIKLIPNKKISLGNSFKILEFSDVLKRNIVDSFISSIVNLTNTDISFDKLINSSTIMTKKIEISGFSPRTQVIRHLGCYPDKDIQKVIYEGIEEIKKLKIFLGKQVYISNIFHRDANTKFLLKNTDWDSFINKNFSVPALIYGETIFLPDNILKLRRFYNKFNLFNNSEFNIQFGRFLSAIDKKIDDKLNSTLDYIILLESLLLDTKQEIKFQFSLYGALFFESSKSEREDLIQFFKYIYDLRSDLVHGNNDKKIRKTIKKITGFDKKWFSRLEKYSHEIILHLVNNNIKSKEEIFNGIKSKLYL